MFFQAVLEHTTGTYTHSGVGITVSHMAEMCAGTAALSQL